MTLPYQSPHLLLLLLLMSVASVIAVRRDEFLEFPQNSVAATGEAVLLPSCRGPNGPQTEQPRVQWTKDDKQVLADDRIQLQNGHLHLHRLRKTDAGLYVCFAVSQDGERNTKTTRLTVVDKPKIIEVPSEVVAKEDSDILLPCRATGDPELSITWKKRKGVLPPHRFRVLDDYTLRIKKIRVHDEGIYVCRAENGVGWQEVEVRITVHSQPTFVTTPGNKWVGLGRRVSFECDATGSPLPAIFWKREKSQNLMFSGQTYGRYSIKQDGTMVIEQAEKSDAGLFVCQAQSVAGSAMATARLEVKGVDSRPPPIIYYGPQNQTLPIHSLASLQCSAFGDPSPSIRWFKNNRVLSLNEPRFALLDSGTLQIHELRRSDTGWYTCKATSETGETAWSGSLSVEPPTDSSIIFRRTPDPSTFPGPPSPPVVAEVRETSVRLNWKPNPNHGASSVSAFTVEYFSHETGEGWTVASDRIQEMHYTVKGLRPETLYRFLVRAQNSQGLSLPSPVTNPVRTKGLNATTVTTASVPLPDDSSVIQLSKGPAGSSLGAATAAGSVVLRPPEAIGSKSMQLRWEVRKNPRFADGFHIHYCVVSEPEREEEEEEEEDAEVQFRPGTCDLQSAPPAIQTVQNGDARTHVLNHLEENTWYKISLRPFHQLTEGAESNSVYAKTLEDVPSAAPMNIQAVANGNNTLKMTWQQPPKQHHNGPLTGYKIFLSSNESSLRRDIWINASIDEVYVHRLSKDAVYSIQVAAYNEKGEGARSSPLLIDYRDVKKERVVSAEHRRHSSWLVVTVIACCGGLLWVGVCTLSVWLCRRRRRRRNRTRQQTKHGARQTKPCVSSSDGADTEQSDQTGTLEDNTYENVASVKGIHSTSASNAVPNASITFPAPPPLPSSEGNSPSYQQGPAINYPSSSGFSSSGQADNFYENYIIKPKPLYACNNQNNSADHSDKSLSLGGYTSPANNTETAFGDSLSQPRSCCRFALSKKPQDRQKPVANPCAVGSTVDQNSSSSPLPFYDFNRRKTSLQNEPMRKIYEGRMITQRPPSTDLYDDRNHGHESYERHYPPRHYHPYSNSSHCHAAVLPYPLQTIQPGATITTSTAEFRLTDSSLATSEPEPLSTYIEDQSLVRRATVVRYFSDTDGLPNNGRQQQYPPSPAPMEPLSTGTSPELQQQKIIMNRPDLGYVRSHSVLLNNERNLQ